jgi:hypothetical protein
MVQVETADIPTLPTSIKYAGFVYIIEFDNGTVKAGRTVEPPKRLANLIATSSGFRIHASRIWLSPAHADYCDNERRILEWARARAGSVQKNEYFTGLSVRETVEFANSLEFRQLTSEEAQQREAQDEKSAAELRKILTGIVPERQAQQTRHDTPEGVNEWVQAQLEEIATALGMYRDDDDEASEQFDSIVASFSDVLDANGSQPDRIGVAAQLIRSNLALVELYARHPHLRGEAVA